MWRVSHALWKHKNSLFRCILSICNVLLLSFYKFYTLTSPTPRPSASLPYPNSEPSSPLCPSSKTVPLSSAYPNPTLISRPTWSMKPLLTTVPYESFIFIYISFPFLSLLEQFLEYVTCLQVLGTNENIEWIMLLS